MKRAIAAAGVLAALAGSGGCKTSPDSEAVPEGIPRAAPSVMTIANVMGDCEDVPLCERECNAGQADSCRRLAVTYEFGKSDAGRDETAGTKYFDRACALGNANGCVSSGQMHEYGHGVPKDPTEATAAYGRACTLGYQVGCANLAIMLENGRGVPKDIERAKVLYDGACKAGAGLACERLKALAADGGH
jgi:TPR repeat protein